METVFVALIAILVIAGMVAWAYYSPETFIIWYIIQILTSN